ncbi:cell division cycle-associated protein 7a isoform X1 [Polypterus senegalus]|uniref:cell division cycle-associated protein 7a isoform X1 n=1 Tax=Polypterus senegalus TaxID=55291 RepID=UPI001966B45E|nr:cell division cycle-associated protein 7a isoform X1 [Polypterus senegalus]
MDFILSQMQASPHLFSAKVVLSKVDCSQFRNVPPVLMETSSSSSSSDDSCDSFGSDGFVKKEVGNRNVKDLAVIFDEDSDTESFCGFSSEELTDVMDAMKMDSVEDESLKLSSKSKAPFNLKVALKFPAKHQGRKRAPPTLSVPKARGRSSDSDLDSDEEKGMSFIEKRALNIKENKAMLARLMAELKHMPGLSSMRRSFPLTHMQPRNPPRRSLGTGPARRNPERSSRIHTRSRSLIDGPPSPTPEEDSDDDKYSLVRRRKTWDDMAEPRRRSSGGLMAIPHVVRPVEDITEMELDNICFNVREKLYNRETGSTCHQCRQKTTDTKTNCRNPDCVGVRGQFCGPCLRNRYGEEVRNALLDPSWYCPPCRGICNCSFCRQREGRCATGVLVYLAKYHGYDNVHAYLKSLKKELEQEEENANCSS